MGGFRERINQLPPVVVVIAVVLLLGVAGAIAYSQMGDSSPSGRQAVTQDMTTTCKCRSCGHVSQARTADLMQMGHIDPIEHVLLRGEGLKCSKCGKYAREVVETR